MPKSYWYKLRLSENISTLLTSWTQPNVVISLFDDVKHHAVLVAVAGVVLEREGAQVVAHGLQAARVVVEGDSWPPLLRGGHAEQPLAAAQVQDPLPLLGEAVHYGALQVLGALGMSGIKKIRSG